MFIKKASIKKLSLFISLFILLQFTFINVANAYTNISPSQVHDLIKSSTPMLIIDVRTPEEYSQGRIPTSVNIPLNILKNQVTNKNIPKSTKIIVYCQKGRRSSKAAKLLDDLGYTEVYNMGGIDNWPYEIVKR